MLVLVCDACAAEGAAQAQASATTCSTPEQLTCELCLRRKQQQATAAAGSGGSGRRLRILCLHGFRQTARNFEVGRPPACLLPAFRPCQHVATAGAHAGRPISAGCLKLAVPCRCAPRACRDARTGCGSGCEMWLSLFLWMGLTSCQLGPNRQQRERQGQRQMQRQGQWQRQWQRQEEALHLEAPQSGRRVRKQQLVTWMLS